MKPRIGSSLVLVVVIMAAIIVVVFGASRLTLVQYNQSNRDEDNLFALYAAKAAVEDGLARFRYNRDAETTNSDGTAATVQRFNLSTGTNHGEISPTIPIGAVTGYNPSNQYYDLKMSFRDTTIGDFSDTAGLNPPLAKDDTLELSGFPNQADPYYLRYRFQFMVTATNDCSTALVQIQQISQLTGSPSPITYDQVTAKKLSTSLFVDSKDTSNLLIHFINGQQSTESLTSTIRLRAYGCGVSYALATSRSINGVANDGPKFDNLITTVTATGYFGQAKRTLVASIDRISGRLISIYDFNLYAGKGSISPPPPTH